MWHLIQHLLGLDSASGTAYLAWSGVLSDLGEIAIIGALAGVLRKHNCEVHHCFRLARHATAAGHHVCRRHHPDGHLTAQAVKEHHHRALLTRRPAPPGKAAERLYDRERDGS